MTAIRGAALATCLALAGCAAQPTMLESALPEGAQRSIELADTPFFAQKKMQCGPAALAEVLSASGVAVTPDALAPFVFVPKRGGSLQVEMEAAPRGHSRLSYRLAPALTAILAELGAHRPVLVLHNYSLPLLPRWHYAVVIGYDATTEKLVLRSGTTRRQTMSARQFVRFWDRAGRWAIVTLRPGELPATADRARYLESAAAFERVARPEDAARAFDAAVNRWPDEPLAWVGRGTARYAQRDLQGAARDYFEALRLDGSESGARNNLAMTLLELGCPHAARAQVETIAKDALADPLRAAVEDTRSQIAAHMTASISDDPESCRAVGR